MLWVRRVLRSWALISVVVTSLLVGAVPAGAADPVQVHVYPRVATEPATLLVQVMITRQEENRAVAVVLDSGEFYSSSVIQLDGAQSPYLSVFTFRDVPAGWYEVRSEVMGRDARVRAAARISMMVFPR